MHARCRITKELVARKYLLKWLVGYFLDGAGILGPTLQVAAGGVAHE
jgi:hypothetical protein